MLKYIQGKRLSRSAGGKIYSKSFSGAKVQHMKHYVIPTIEELNPDEVILHVGTNDLRHDDARTVADGIVNLAQQIYSSYPCTKIAISEIITREDDSSLDAKGKEVNKIVARFCKQTSWKIISHSNITKHDLNQGGLHLNRDGCSSLAKNFIAHCTIH